MSWALLKAVCHLSLPPLQRHLLMVLITYVNRNGEAFPSVKTLARETGRSARQVQRDLKDLVHTGFLTITSPARQHRPATYQVTFHNHQGRHSVTPEPTARGDKMSPLSTNQRRQRVTSGESRGDKGRNPGVTRSASRGDRLSPELSTDPKKEGGGVLQDAPPIVSHTAKRQNHRQGTTPAQDLGPPATTFSLYVTTAELAVLERRHAPAVVASTLDQLGPRLGQVGDPFSYLDKACQKTAKRIERSAPQPNGPPSPEPTHGRAVMCAGGCGMAVRPPVGHEGPVYCQTCRPGKEAQVR